MKLKLTHIANSFALLTAIVAAPAAMAADGTITFNGTVSATTCSIAAGGGATGSNNMTVTLPTVSAAALNATGSTAGRTPFSIVLTGCSGSSTQVSTFFENGTLVDQATGQLALSTGSTAQNVEVALLNNSQDAIVVGAPTLSGQKSQTVALNSGGSTALNYFAEYIATGGAATPGTVNTTVSYSLVYQ